ncbi:hypothetical protein scyTo_0018970 [Scyliorhinus torazame]|uniref:Small EDRK-rich factor-like N-terminal domain-containing protein n=1 Tax=Scyliorhinus torazame TaxID=75743 RepID=A0A401PPZ8_SCYTO|nr:hypothetical protein [Scyliorhinus torazame]
MAVYSSGSGATVGGDRVTRGNQRELVRQKNAKKSREQSKRKRKDDGLSAAARKQRDAEIMQQKQQRN